MDSGYLIQMHVQSRVYNEMFYGEFSYHLHFEKQFNGHNWRCGIVEKPIIIFYC